MFLFGVFEYCRFVFLQQVMLNAAREGARFAVVNAYDVNVVANTQTRVKQKMAGQDSKYTYSCQVYMCNNAGTNIGSPGNAKFGELIAVQVDCDFVPIVPNLLFMKKTLKLDVKSIMASEAN